MKHCSPSFLKKRKIFACQDIGQGATHHGRPHPESVQRPEPTRFNPVQCCVTNKHYTFLSNYKSTKTQGKREPGRIRAALVFLFAFQHTDIKVLPQTALNSSTRGIFWGIILRRKCAG